MSVSATSVEAQRAVMNATPSGTSNRPSSPVRKKRGTKLTMMIKVELRIGRRTSREALKMTESADFCSSRGRARFSRRWRNTFSTSTIASSTSEPMAIAMPPRLIVLMVSPKRWSVSSETMSERGMVTSEITVVRTFMRKSRSTMTTKMPPSKSAFFTLSMALLMKRSWR